MNKLILFFLLLFPTLTFAESLTITGVNFGDTGPTIYSWDNFEAQTPGAVINGTAPVYGYPWQVMYGTDEYSPKFSSTEALGTSSNSVLVDWDDVGGFQTISAFGWRVGYVPEIYVSFWRYQDNLPATSVPFNSKILYTNCMTNDQADLVEFLPFNIGGTSTRFRAQMQSGSGSGDNPFNKSSGVWHWTYPEGPTGMPEYVDQNFKWYRHEVWIDWDTPYTSRNGSVMIWLNNNSILNPVQNGTLDMIRDDNPNGRMDEIFLGYMFQTGGVSWYQRKVYFDNVYMASNRARVEIGNSQTYANCTLKNIQNVSYWSDTSIYISETNTPSFQSGEDVYVYVINTDGNVSNSIPYTIGSTAGEAPNISNIVISRRLAIEGAEVTFQWENIGGVATTMTPRWGDAWGRDGTSIAYQDSLHHTFGTDIGVDTLYNFRLIATNAAGSDTLIVKNAVKVLFDALVYPYD